MKLKVAGWKTGGGGLLDAGGVIQPDSSSRSTGFTPPVSLPAVTVVATTSVSDSSASIRVVSDVGGSMGSDGGNGVVGTSGKSLEAVVVIGAFVVISVDDGDDGDVGDDGDDGDNGSDTDGTVVNTIGGAIGGSTVGRAKLRSSTSVGELVTCGFFSSTVLRFCIKSLISKLLSSPASLSKFCRKDICGSN